MNSSNYTVLSSLQSSWPNDLYRRLVKELHTPEKKEAFEDVYELILSRGCNARARHQLAIKFEYFVPEVITILSQLADRETKSLKLFALAERGRLEELTNELEKDGVWINAADRRGFTPLMVASSKNRLKAVNLLLQNGADATTTFTVKSACFTATKLAAHLGHSQVLAALLNHTHGQQHLGNDPMAVEALVQAARQGRKGCVELLFHRKVNLNASNAWGCTALNGAASMGQTAIVKLLLEKGVDPNHRDQKGRSALGSAHFGKYLGTAHLLVESGAIFEGEANDSVCYPDSTQGLAKRFRYDRSADGKGTPLPRSSGK